MSKIIKGGFDGKGKVIDKKAEEIKRLCMQVLTDTKNIQDIIVLTTNKTGNIRLTFSTQPVVIVIGTLDIAKTLAKNIIRKP